MSLFSLSRSFPSIYGVPVIEHVDVSMFEKRYFTRCLECTFCADLCCSYGVDVDFHHIKQLEARADAIEAYTGVARDRWFTKGVIDDPEMPGGGSRRTRVVDGACVFLDRERRGCSIHRFCDEFGLDYHDLKSIVDCLFPLTVTDRTLCPADEVDDGTLLCLSQGPTLYRGLREELRYYFGEELVGVLDGMEGETDL